MRKIIEFIVRYLYSLFSPKKAETENEVNIKEYKDYTTKEHDINIFKEINEYRQSKGLSFVENAPGNITNIIGEHAVWLNDKVSSKEDVEIFAHWYAYNRFEQIKLRTSSKVRCGEVVAYDYRHPKSAVYGWDGSFKHNKTLNGDFNYVAIASEGKCVVAIFYKI